MPFHSAGLLRYYTFDSFERLGLIHGIFTRHGGTSPEPWDSLNHGGLVGDERANQIENRKRAFEVLNRKVESIFDVWQVHGTNVICANAPRPLDQAHEKADAILTNRSEISLFMRFADCVPVFLHDPVRQVAGIVHAGWQGTVKNTVGAAVDQMVNTYGSQPKDIICGIGPSICADHYPVGEEVIRAARQVFGSEADQVLRKQAGQVHFDLWQANKINLERAGVESVEIAGVCTACQTVDWFSHRAEHGNTGRFGALLALSGSRNGSD